MDDVVAGGIMNTAQQHTIEMPRFGAGHLVRFTETFPYRRNAAAGNYEVLARLPTRDGEFQYRIKSNREPYQRVVKEGELERA
jgi:hypothetical protein